MPCRRRSRRRDGSCAKQVNPLKRQHGSKVIPEDWLDQAFGGRQHLPLVIDVGTGSGEWVLAAAEKFRDVNFLGLDVRDGALPPSTLENAAFLAANSSEGDVDSVLRLARKQRCRISFVFAQFPDPHWKRKHRRRAMITPSLCRAIALADPIAFVLRTDVEHVAQDARHAALHTTPSFLLEDDVHSSNDATLLQHLLSIPTERLVYKKSRDPEFLPHLCIFKTRPHCRAMVPVLEALRK